MSDTLDTHSSTSIIRMLNIGESGSGKTGALASLAKAGYTLWILDYDNGLDILANLLRDDIEALKRIHYKLLRDTVSMSSGVPKLKPPIHAWKDAGRTLAEWKADTFTSNDIIVIDTLTTMSMAAFNEAMMLGGRLNQRPQQNDYGWMADSVLLFIDGLTGDDIHCNVIVNTHIRFLAGSEEDQTTTRGLPNAKGQQIPKDIGKFFNTITLTRSTGSGPATKRIISTQPQGVVEVKNSNPVGVKATYPIDTGMAAMFQDILGHGPTLTGKNT